MGRLAEKKTRIGCNRAFSLTLDKTCSNFRHSKPTRAPTALPQVSSVRCLHIKPALQVKWQHLTAPCTCATNPTLPWNSLLCTETALGICAQPAMAQPGKAKITAETTERMRQTRPDFLERKPTSGETRPNKRGESDSRGTPTVKIF